MEEIPHDAPARCPGTSAQQAGKSEACQDCPNRYICASGQPADATLDEIAQRMARVKHKLLILSGKGGVGKSMIASLLARSLARKYPNENIGLLDVDICGPSLPRMFGVSEEKVHQSNSGWSPVYVENNLCVMSAGFLLDSEDEAVVWRGPKKNGLIKQFLKDVDWGDLHFLIIDTPPGTSDEHLTVVQHLLKSSHVDGAVLITCPQEVSLSDVRKQVNFCRKFKMPVVGVVENMSIFECPKCHKQSSIFCNSTGGAAALCSQYNMRLLGRVVLDSKLARCCDEGVDCLEQYPHAEASKSLNSIFEAINTFCVDKVNT